MKRIIVLSLCSSLVLCGCGTYTGEGAYTGSALGSILGSAIGGLSDGPRGSDIGTIIGMAGGAIIGGAIGSAADNARQQSQDTQYQSGNGNYDNSSVSQESSNRDYGNYNQSQSNSGYDPTNSGDDRIYDFGSTDYTGDYSASKPMQKNPASSSVEDLASGYTLNPQIEVRNARFVDDNHDGVLSSNELSKVIFEVMNKSNATIYDVQPTVVETTGNKHIYISPNIHVEKIEPGKGIRYTAMVKTDKRLKDGSARFCISVLQGDKLMSKVSEFTIVTKR